MTDFDYEVLCRKRLARMSKFRKCGSKSKKCSLSTDNMSKREWKERCGEVQSCNLNQPMDWKSFKGMPDTMQKEYIQHLVHRYNANATSLGEMFHVTAETVRRHFTINNFDVKFRAGNGMSKKQKDAWSRFISEDKEPVKENEQSVDDAPVPDPVSMFKEEKTTSLTEFTLVFEGKIDASMISNSLRGIIGKDAVGKIEISCVLQ